MSRRRPTAAGTAAAVLVVVGLVVAVVLREPAVAAGTAPVLLALVVGVLAAGPGRTTAAVTWSAPRVLQGSTVTLDLVVTSARGGHLRIDLVLEGGLVPSGEVGRDGTVTDVTAGTTGVGVELSPTRWGPAGVGGVSLVWTGPLGLVAERHDVEVLPAPLRVLPPPAALRGLLAPHRTGGWSGLRTARTAGRGTEFADVRPFAAGDRPGDVHWPTTMRRGEPWVAARHPEHSVELVLVLDLVDAALLPEVVRVGVNLADAHLRARDRVGVVALGGVLTWLGAAGGERQRIELVDRIVASQHVATQVSRTARHLPPAALPHGALVVVLTALRGDVGASIGRDPESRTNPARDPRQQVGRLAVELRGRGHDVVVLDLEHPPPSVGDDPVHAAAATLVRLRRRLRRDALAELGLPVMGVPHGGPVASALVGLRAARREGVRA